MPPTAWKTIVIDSSAMSAEAMVSGIPVVGSSSGEIPNVIGEAGLVYPEGDVPALRDRLEALMADPALWGRLSERCRARALAHFTQAQVAAETVDLYHEMMGSADRDL